MFPRPAHQWQHAFITSTLPETTREVQNPLHLDVPPRAGWGPYTCQQGRRFPGYGHTYWVGLTVGWRYLGGGSLWYVQMVTMLSRSGTWRGLD